MRSCRPKFSEHIVGFIGTYAESCEKLPTPGGDSFERPCDNAGKQAILPDVIIDSSMTVVIWIVRSPIEDSVDDGEDVSVGVVSMGLIGGFST